MKSSKGQTSRTPYHKVHVTAPSRKPSETSKQTQIKVIGNFKSPAAIITKSSDRNEKVRISRSQTRE